MQPGPGGPDPQLVHALLACQHAADLADRPGDPPTAAAELRSLLTPPYRGYRLLYLLHDPSGNLAGWARLGLYTAFQQELAHAAIVVRPAARRRGAGTALLTALTLATHRHGRRRLVLDGPRRLATERFAERHGLELTGRELRSRLDLDNPQLAELCAQWRSRWGSPGSGVHRRQDLVALRWSGPCPEAYVPSYLQALDALQAASAKPGPGAQEDPFTRAEVRHRELTAAAAGLREYTACLIAPQSGRIAALSTAHTADGLRGEQNETVVVPEFRGRGLALRVKTQLIRDLRAAEPGLAMLDTHNAVDNTRMLAVNQRLGFQPLDTHGAWTLRL
ncbi:MAG TPA: GNAT family N-acetyltransferase [Actinocrinis sp.]|nr:GNAT family N-acetyltransferase [Actinocrinis sp.]